MNEWTFTNLNSLISVLSVTAMAAIFILEWITIATMIEDMPCWVEVKNDAEATGQDTRSICSCGWTFLQPGVLSSAPKINQQLWCVWKCKCLNVCAFERNSTSQHHKSKDAWCCGYVTGLRGQCLYPVPWSWDVAEWIKRHVCMIWWMEMTFFCLLK